MNDPDKYVQSPARAVEIDGRTHYIYRCDEGSECGGKAESKPRKTKIRRGYAFVCGECQGNFM